MTTTTITRRWHFSLSHSAIGIWRGFLPLPHSIAAAAVRARSLALCFFHAWTGRIETRRPTASGDGRGGGTERPALPAVRPSPFRQTLLLHFSETAITSGFLEKSHDCRSERAIAIGASAYIIQSATRTVFEANKEGLRRIFLRRAKFFFAVKRRRMEEERRGEETDRDGREWRMAATCGFENGCPSAQPRRRALQDIRREEGGGMMTGHN